MPQANTAAKDDRPWYKEPWPWILISLPLSAILAGVATLVLAIRSNDGLVATDYYKQGLTINRTLAEEQLAASMALRAQALFANGEVRVSLQAKEGIALPAGITLTLLSPAHEKADQTLTLSGKDGHFAGPLPALRSGRWNMMIEDADKTWRLRAQAGLPQSEPVMFATRALAKP